MRTFSIRILAIFALNAGVALGQQKDNPAMPCYRALADDARFAPIRDKVALGPDRDSEMQRARKITDRASEKEKPVIATWRDAREMCHRQELPYYATRDTEISALARQHFGAVQALIGQLHDGKVTYGEFATRRAALYEKVNRDIEEVRKSILPPKPTPHPVGKQ